MSTNLTQIDLQAAEAAVENAQRVRALHRRKTPRGSSGREADIKIATQRLASAMKPLRSYLCGFHFGPQGEAAWERRDRVQELSRAIQAERRRLWKMAK